MQSRHFCAALLPVFLLVLLAAVPVRAAHDLWVPIGPGGGEITTLVIAPSNSNVLYAGTKGGGVFKSVNGAATWMSVHRGLTNLDILALAAHPRNAAVVYAGTLGGGVFKSVDGGASWGSLGSPFRYVASLAVHPRRPSIIYAGTFGGGLFKSTDGGASWLPVNRNLRRAFVRTIALHPRDTSIVYISVEANPRAGVFKSTDGGATWRAVNNGLPGSPDGAFAVVLDPASPETLYTYPIGAEVIYRSTNGARSWAPTRMQAALPLVVGPGGAVWAGPFQKSFDQGRTVIRTGWRGQPLNGLAIDPRNGEVVYAGQSFEGISRTVDGGATWQSRNEGFWASTIRALAVGPGHPSTVYATAASQGFFRSLDDGATWRRPARPRALEVTELVADPADPETLYGALDGQLLAKSTDRGATWQPLPLPEATCHLVLALAVDPVSSSNLYLGSSEPHGRCPEICHGLRSTDGGESWTCMSIGGLWVLEVAPRDPATLYGFNGHLYRSTDRGITWTQTGQGLPELIDSLAIDPSDASILYAGARDGVYKSVNSGATWQRSSAGLPPGHVATLVIDPLTPAVLYAGLTDVNRSSVPTPGLDPRDFGVYRSTDGGAGWSRVSEGLPAARFNGFLEIDPDDPETLYAGTNDGGVYKLIASGR